MAEIQDMAAAIGDRDLRDAALLMASVRQTFTARDFTDFLEIAGYRFEEEAVNELLLSLAERGALREVGPAVYAKLVEQPRDRAAAPGGPRIGGQP